MKRETIGRRRENECRSKREKKFEESSIKLINLYFITELLLKTINHRSLSDVCLLFPRFCLVPQLRVKALLYLARLRRQFSVNRFCNFVIRSFEGGKDSAGVKSLSSFRIVLQR